MIDSIATQNSKLTQKLILKRLDTNIRPTVAVLVKLGAVGIRHLWAPTQKVILFFNAVP